MLRNNQNHYVIKQQQIIGIGITYDHQKIFNFNCIIKIMTVGKHGNNKKHARSMLLIISNEMWYDINMSQKTNVIYIIRHKQKQDRGDLDLKIKCKKTVHEGYDGQIFPAFELTPLRQSAT